MKRSPMSRGSKPLRRKTWMKRRRSAPRRSDRVRDPEHMRIVRKLPCAVRTTLPTASTKCTGRVQADHAGQRPYGRKADDATCIPLCRHHHGERTDFTGTFKGWTREQMRAWLDGTIVLTVHQVQRLRVQRKHHGDQ